MEPITTPEAATENMHTVIPIVGAMGIRILDAGPGHATVELPAGPNGNHFGVLYAGSLFTAAEVLGGIIPQASFDLQGELAGFVPLVKKAEISFLRPGLGDVRATATVAAEEIERVRQEALATGKSEFVVEAEITDAQGTVVATTRALNQLRKLG
ncbi:PaaI family thioesterase [Nocardioides stalactiti]|uniref:PaaI family thioesterase n=1 Tax=Nocardioides stalactiti TaxID=2755356 RepID=UPI0016002E2F|nr:YiiD C-terminal domain-containing protein [Nocardioides stalactiti]